MTDDLHTTSPDTYADRTLVRLDPAAHAHTSQCWWDHTKPGWRCAGPAAGSPPAGAEIADAVAEVDGAEVDVRDMIVVHTAMLREFRLLRGAVADTAAGDLAQARVVDAHLGLMCDLLHHHHEGEDALLWPVLRERLMPEHQQLLDLAEAQHAGLDRALGEVATARRTWIDGAGAAGRDVLVDALEQLSSLLTEHLEGEERDLLPLAAVHLSAEDWYEVGAHGAASTPKPALPLVFGMFAYEGDPEVLRSMLASAPAVPRLLVPRIAPRIYARRAAKVYGTRTP